MEEKSNVTKLTQKDYQKKYDEKTQSVTIKYTPADMSDYDRMMKYLEKTGKSRSSFIKELINDFFENEKYAITESRIADYYKIYNVDGELLDKLKAVVGEEKYNIILGIFKTFVEDELYDAYIYKGDDVDVWIEDFIDEIKNGDVDINVSDKEFEKIIDKSLSHNLKSVFYGWNSISHFLNFVKPTKTEYRCYIVSKRTTIYRLLSLYVVVFLFAEIKTTKKFKNKWRILYMKGLIAKHFIKIFLILWKSDKRMF